MKSLTEWLDDEEQASEVRQWNRRCLFWEAVAITAVVIVMGGCTGLAVWLW